MSILPHALLDVAGDLVEVDADADYLLTVKLKRESVILVLDLCQRLLGGAVKFELHDIAELRGLDHQVYAAR